MAGHSQFKNIMHRKGKQDAKRAKVFTKIIRELTVAARSGAPDPASNPRLRAGVLAAREANMPKDTIARAIKRGAGGEEGSGFEEVRYEGFGPGGVAIIVEALTDNRNRTAGDIRTAFGKHGGSLAETGSVNFMFARAGVIRYPAARAGESPRASNDAPLPGRAGESPRASNDAPLPGRAVPPVGGQNIDADAMFEAALEAGATDVRSDQDGHEIVCGADDFNAVREALERKFGEAEAARLDWRPTNAVSVDGETAENLLKLLETLEDNDDVQRVASNFEISDEVMARLSA